MRFPIPFAITAGLGACSLLMGSCSSPPSGPSAVSLITESQNAVAQASAVHYVHALTYGAQGQSITGSVSATEADVVSLVNGSPLIELRLVGTTIYFVSESATILAKNLGLSATTAKTWTGRWISVLPTDSQYNVLIATLSIPAETTNLYPTGANLSVNQNAAIRGHRAIAITGDANSSKSSSQSTIFIDPHSKLPIGASAIGKVASATQRVAVVFTRWNVPFSVKAPSAATPVSSIAG